MADKVKQFLPPISADQGILICGAISATFTLARYGFNMLAV